VRSILVLLVLLLDVIPLFAQPDSTPQGHLVIIGGGRRDADIMKAFVGFAGGAQAVVAAFPMASSLADSMGEEVEAEFKKLGVKELRYMNITRTQADDPAILARMEGVTGVYFPGGDQSKLTAVLNGTKMLEHIRALYYRGGVLGGTSAGAAVMSRIMITGDEKNNPDSSNAFWFIRGNNIVTSEGFGFVDDMIVDQHFIRRKRHNRLLSIVLENPTKLGVGIDESTAIIVNPDRTFHVVGEATVFVLDASKASAVESDKNGNLAAAGMRLHLLKEGDRFDLKTREPLPARGAK